jgi:hypothetical protein
MTATLLTTTQVTALTGIPTGRVRTWALSHGILPTPTGRTLTYPAGPVRRAAAHRQPAAPPMDPATARQVAALTGLHRMVWRAQVGAL